LLRMGIQMMMNSDWKGDYIANPDGTVPEWLRSYFSYVLTSLEPIVMSSTTSTAPGSNISLPERLVGIRQAPQYAIDPQGYHRGMSAIETEKWLKKLRFDWKHKLISDKEYQAAVQQAKRRQLQYGGPQQ